MSGPLFACLVSLQHAILEKLANIDVSRRHVGDMSATFPAKIGVKGQRCICQFVVIEAVDLLTDESVSGVLASYCGLLLIIKTTEERRGFLYSTLPHQIESLRSVHFHLVEACL
jgi:hypothetical protein